MELFFYKGLACPVCGKQFEENEDIVACPHCGLPHHRACWQQEGHCHLEHLHDTPEQWSREQTSPTEQAEPVRHAQEGFTGQICPRCRTRNPQFAEICTHCGAPLQAEEWHSERTTYTPPAGAQYSPFAAGFAPDSQSYSPEEAIGEFKAKDLAAVVGQNAAYYIPRFRRIENGESGGWNWAAFLLAPYWLLYRKQYLLGILYFFCQTAYSFAHSYFFRPLQTITSTEEMMNWMQSMLADESSLWFLLPIFVLSAILFAGRILLGLKANQLYKAQCENRIRKARERTPDLSAGELSSVGGTSMTLAAVFYIIPTLLSYLLVLFQTM